MKNILLTFLSLATTLMIHAQDKFYTKAGNIKFDATAAKSPEKIVAENHASVCVLDTKSGAIQFSVPMSGFEFEKALMQEHFNENYVETKLYPKSEFKGTINYNSGVTYAKDGTYKVKVKGTLNMHGLSKEVETEGEILVQKGKITAKAAFTVLLNDYNIKIPGVVADKVGTQARIEVDCPLELLVK
jgi:polyisoprenoid-binding protein YceI